MSLTTCSRRPSVFAQLLPLTAQSYTELYEDLGSTRMHCPTTYLRHWLHVRGQVTVRLLPSGIAIVVTMTDAVIWIMYWYVLFQCGSWCMSIWTEPDAPNQLHDCSFWLSFPLQSCDIVDIGLHSGICAHPQEACLQPPVQSFTLSTDVNATQSFHTLYKFWNRNKISY